MRFIKHFNILFMVIAGLLFLASCTKEDDYKKFQENGEIIYAGTLDTVIAQAGKNKINLLMNLGNDAAVNRIKVYWNDRLDSAQITIPRPITSDIVNLMIPNLEVGTYNFEIYTYNTNDNASVVKNVSGAAYGSDYENSLVNRRIKNVVTRLDSVIFTWNDANQGLISTEVTYTKKNGDIVTLTIPASEGVTRLTTDYLVGSTLLYKSTYKYDVNAYEPYTVADYSTLILERQLPKNVFKQFILPTDVTDGSGWVMTNLWNGTYTGNGFATQSGKNAPVWFTFDTGISTSISNMIYHMPSDRIFAKEATKSFEVWGSDNPASDGSWASWTLLRTCLSVKPSASAIGTNTPADVAAAAAGQEFVMPEDLPKTRYIRIKALANWAGTGFVAMGELTFFTRNP